MIMLGLVDRPAPRHNAIMSGAVINARQGEDGIWRGHWALTGQPCRYYDGCGWGTDWASVDYDRWTCWEGG